NTRARYRIGTRSCLTDIRIGFKGPPKMPTTNAIATATEYGGARERRKPSGEHRRKQVRKVLRRGRRGEIALKTIVPINAPTPCAPSRIPTLSAEPYSSRTSAGIWTVASGASRKFVRHRNPASQNRSLCSRRKRNPKVVL